MLQNLLLWYVVKREGRMAQAFCHFLWHLTHFPPLNFQHSEKKLGRLFGKTDCMAESLKSMKVFFFYRNFPNSVHVTHALYSVGASVSKFPWTLTGKRLRYFSANRNKQNSKRNPLLENIRTVREPVSVTPRKVFKKILLILISFRSNLRPLPNLTYPTH